MSLLRAIWGVSPWDSSWIESTTPDVEPANLGVFSRVRFFGAVAPAPGPGKLNAGLRPSPSSICDCDWDCD